MPCRLLGVQNYAFFCGNAYIWRKIGAPVNCRHTGAAVKWFHRCFTGAPVSNTEPYPQLTFNLEVAGNQDISEMKTPEIKSPMFRGQRLLQRILPRETWYKCVLPMVSESIHINIEQHKYLISDKFGISDCKGWQSVFVYQADQIVARCFDVRSLISFFFFLQWADRQSLR